MFTTALADQNRSNARQVHRSVWVGGRQLLPQRRNNFIRAVEEALLRGAGSAHASLISMAGHKPIFSISHLG